MSCFLVESGREHHFIIISRHLPSLDTADPHNVTLEFVSGLKRGTESYMTGLSPGGPR